MSENINPGEMEQMPETSLNEEIRALLEAVEVGNWEARANTQGFSSWEKYILAAMNRLVEKGQNSQNQSLAFFDHLLDGKMPEKVEEIAEDSLPQKREKAAEKIRNLGVQVRAACDALLDGNLNFRLDMPAEADLEGIGDNLNRMLERCRDWWEVAPVPVRFVDKDLQVRYINPAALDLQDTQADEPDSASEEVAKGEQPEEGAMEFLSPVEEELAAETLANDNAGEAEGFSGEEMEEVELETETEVADDGEELAQLDEGETPEDAPEAQEAPVEASLEEDNEDGDFENRILTAARELSGEEDPAALGEQSRQSACVTMPLKDRDDKLTGFFEVLSDPDQYVGEEEETPLSDYMMAELEQLTSALESWSQGEVGPPPELNPPHPDQLPGYTLLARLQSAMIHCRGNLMALRSGCEDLNRALEGGDKTASLNRDNGPGIYAQLMGSINSALNRLSNLYQAELQGKDDEAREIEEVMREKMQEDLDRALSDVEKHASQVTGYLLQLTDGDLTEDFLFAGDDLLSPEFHGAFERLSTAVQSLTDQFRETVWRALEAEKTLETGAAYLHALLSPGKGGPKSQSAIWKEVEVSLEEMRRRNQLNAGMAGQSSDWAEDALEGLGKAGETSVKGQELSARIRAGLKENRQGLQKMEKFLFKASLVAVNGSIEAARAGKLGRGFAVVADQLLALLRQMEDNVEKCLLKGDDLFEDLQEEKALSDSLAEGVGEAHEKTTAIQEVLDEISASHYDQDESVSSLESLIASLEEYVSSQSTGQEETEEKMGLFNAQLEELNGWLQRFHLDPSYGEQPQPSLPNHEAQEKRLGQLGLSAENQDSDTSGNGNEGFDAT